MVFLEVAAKASAVGHLGHLSSFHLPAKYLLMAFGVIGVFGLFVVGVGAMLHRGQTAADIVAPGLYGVVGRMGGGKSYFLTLCAVRAVKLGRPVFANYELTGATQYETWGEVLDVPDGALVLMDECHLWWPVEAWKCPPEVMGWCSQLRKRNITMLWASQHEAFVAKRLARLTFAVWSCVRYKRGHQYSLFDGATFWTPSKRELLTRMYVVRSAEVMASYQTGEIVRPGLEWGDGTGMEHARVLRRQPPAPPASTAGGEAAPGQSELEVIGGRVFSRLET